MTLNLARIRGFGKPGRARTGGPPGAVVFVFERGPEGPHIERASKREVVSEDGDGRDHDEARVVVFEDGRERGNRRCDKERVQKSGSSKERVQKAWVQKARVQKERGQKERGQKAWVQKERGQKERGQKERGQKERGQKERVQ